MATHTRKVTRTYTVVAYRRHAEDGWQVGLLHRSLSNGGALVRGHNNQVQHAVEYQVLVPNCSIILCRRRGFDVGE